MELKAGGFPADAVASGYTYLIKPYIGGIDDPSTNWSRGSTPRNAGSAGMGVFWDQGFGSYNICEPNKETVLGSTNNLGSYPHTFIFEKGTYDWEGKELLVGPFVTILGISEPQDSVVFENVNIDVLGGDDPTGKPGGSNIFFRYMENIFIKSGGSPSPDPSPSGPPIPPGAECWQPVDGFPFPISSSGCQTCIKN